MGAMLPKAVESTIVERHPSKHFVVAVSEMNGWRRDMEDAHIVFTQDDWGFFGVYDGHGGGQCSEFVAKRIRDELVRKGCPKDDTSVKRLVMGVDEAFLDTKQPSGSTGAMCIVHKPASRGGKVKLRVVNVGDSRVLLGRRDGSIVDGGGTDSGLTTDHKPDHPGERQRIYRCGGHVEEANGGCARVNGELAVSRGFGDAEYKKTGGPAPEDRPVTSDPEMQTFHCDEDDFVLIVCDGVSEGDFPNPQVVRHVAAALRESGDPGAVCRSVCHKAVEQNSKDNITCMLILLRGSNEPAPAKEFRPGPLTAPNHKAFMAAYEVMAQKAGLSLAQACELRYESLVEELAKPSISAIRAHSLKSEVDKFGRPPGAKGSADRAAYFRNWQSQLAEQQDPGEGGDGSDPDFALMRMLMARPGGQDMLMGLMGGGGTGGSAPSVPSWMEGRRVIAPDTTLLKRAVDDHPVLEWDSRMAGLAGYEGVVKTDDTSDGTSNVCFPPPLGIVAWLPTHILISVDGSTGAGAPAARQGRQARAGGVAQQNEPPRERLPRVNQLSRGGSNMLASSVGRLASPASQTADPEPRGGRRAAGTYAGGTTNGRSTPSSAPNPLGASGTRASRSSLGTSGSAVARNAIAQASRSASA